MGYNKPKLGPYQHNTLVVKDSTIGTLNHKQAKYIQFIKFNGLEENFYFNKCCCNEINAIIKRHCLGYINDPENGNEYDFEVLRHEISIIAQSFKPYFINYRKLHFGEVICNTRLCIRKRYIRARTNLVNNRINLQPIHSNIKSFIKFEKMDIEKLVEGKPPRLIQYRSYEYLYLLKSMLCPYSLFIKEKGNHIIDKETEYVQDLNEIFTKTMTFPEMATALRKSFDEVTDCVVLCIDHSKFDGHIVSELLEIEQGFFSEVIGDPNLSSLLSHQIKNRCMTQNGIRYNTIGHRMSGEYNTSDGNSILNYGMLRCFLRYYKCKRFRIHVNGDDSLIMIEYNDYKRLINVFDKDKIVYFERFNMETKLDRVCFDFRKLSYCQMSPIRIDNKWTMIKNPYRSMSRFAYAPFKYLQCINRYIAGISLCELAVNVGVPIVQQFILYNLSQSLVKPLGSVDKIPARLSTNSIRIMDISYQTRLDFEEAFGINISDQLNVEKELEGITSKSLNLQAYLKQYQNFHNN